MPLERPAPLREPLPELPFPEPLGTDALVRDEYAADLVIDAPAPDEPLRETLRFLEVCEVATASNVTEWP